MKVRVGFVSNSSTSSFVIVGVAIDSMKISEKFKDIPEETVENDECNEFLEERIYNANSSLDVRSGLENYNESDLIIGCSIERIKDDQTFKEFKQEVLEELKKIGWMGDDVGEIDLLIDAGYDG